MSTNLVNPVNVANTVLTPKELQCLYYAACDKDCHETAALLSLKPNTVKAYRSLILQKLGCRTITAAVMVALERGWMTNPRHQTS